MAVLVLSINIKNRRVGDIKSENDIKYPVNEAEIFANGCVSREFLKNDIIF